MKTVGKIIKYIFYTFIFAVCALVILRSCIMFDYYPSQMKSILWTDSAKQIYLADSKSFEAYSQTLVFSYDNPDEGNFFASNQLIIPSAKQLQITVRYNDSTLERFAEKSDMEIDDISFVYYLSDQDGNHYPLSLSASDRAFNLYNYARLVFEGVDISKATNLYLDIYIEGAVELDGKPAACIPLYDSERSLKEYKLSGSEKANAKK